MPIVAAAAGAGGGGGDELLMLCAALQLCQRRVTDTSSMYVRGEENLQVTRVPTTGNSRVHLYSYTHR